MKLSAICNTLNEMAPLALQEDYDNSGLILGDPSNELDKAIVCLDITMEVLKEAKESGAGLVISHHPVIFSSFKKLTYRDEKEQMIAFALKNDIAIFAMHTNLDNLDRGFNASLAEKLGLENTRILSPMQSKLKKLIVFCPQIHADKVRQAMFEAGAGHIGNYDSCSFNTEGSGSFRGLEGTNPFVGDQGKLHYEKEIKIESVVPAYMLKGVITAMLLAHPYEEVAYDVYALENSWDKAGAGIIGDLKEELPVVAWLSLISEVLGTTCIRHSVFQKERVKKVALCGGSGSFLIGNAIAAGADSFVTGDIKYHQFQECESMLLVDAGHFETERLAIDWIVSGLKKKIPNFAVLKTGHIINPVRYFIKE